MTPLSLDNFSATGELHLVIAIARAVPFGETRLAMRTRIDCLVPQVIEFSAVDLEPIRGDSPVEEDRRIRITFRKHLITGGNPTPGAIAKVSRVTPQK